MPELCVSIKDYSVFGVFNSSCKYTAKTKQKKKKVMYLAFLFIFSTCPRYVIAFQFQREFSGSRRLIRLVCTSYMNSPSVWERVAPLAQLSTWKHMLF